MIDLVIELAKAAGSKTLDIYNNGDFNITIKSDDSPLTKADLMSNAIIIGGLRDISSYPIVTEENPVDYDIRKDWDKFWLVDPLDGTKEFISKNNDFTVNIALIEKGVPTLGVVYAPALNLLYWAEKDAGAFKNKGERIFNETFHNYFTFLYRKTQLC
ncbi:MAG: hypothetical protein IEMM0008_1654 [bacterium]|nr:MAG: hypothetical protein IEMM0008_1654 [bacterium]